ncbi:DUF3253 domain-containing protein [Mycolicibacterium moriokaense]|nr:DUF3253 domain-containing protein [Mycolicibacterium moriokaense]
MRTCYRNGFKGREKGLSLDVSEQQLREVILDLAREGAVVITQGGDVVDPDATWRGPIRIRAR